MADHESEPIHGDSPAFTTTHWSIVLASRAADPARSAVALEELCRRYWFPLYAFARREGRRPEDAQDLTQGFFHHLLSRGGLMQVDPSKGRFRTFLLTSFRHFAGDQGDRERALKRGGGSVLVSWDAVEAEERYIAAPAGGPAAEESFDRDWAWETLRQALGRLRREQEGRGNAAAFSRLEPYLTGEPPVGFYEQLSAAAGRTEAALRVEMHRLRQRLGELLRESVAATVAHPGDVADEIRHLRDLLAG